MKKDQVDEIIERNRWAYRNPWENSPHEDFFKDVVLPAIENAVTTLKESDSSNEKLLLIVEHYVMPLELKEEALDILISRFASKELMLIIKNYGIKRELQERLSEKLLKSLIEIRKNEN